MISYIEPLTKIIARIIARVNKIRQGDEGVEGTELLTLCVNNSVPSTRPLDICVVS